MSTEDTFENQNSVILEEGITIALLTVAVYAAFLLKEIGYAHLFDIPPDVISTSEVGLALAAKAFLFGVSSYVAKVNLIWIFTPRTDRLIAILVRRFITISLLIGFAMYPYLATGLSIWWIAVPLTIFFFFHFLWPFITQREKHSYESKMEAQMELERNGNHDIMSSVLRLLGGQWHITFLVIFATMTFSYGLGRKEAIEQSSFFAVDERPGWFVLKIYDDLVVTALFDVIHKKLEGHIELTKLADGSPLRLHKVEVGVLNNLHK